MMRFQQLSHNNQTLILIAPAILLAVGTAAFQRPAFFSKRNKTIMNVSSPDSSSPRLDECEQKEEQFWSKAAKKYSQQPIKDEETHQKKLAITREYLTKDSKVFEFGCGTGSTALLHAPYVKHIHATDISLAMIQIAQDKAVEQNVTNATFEQASLDKVSIPSSDDELYDVALGLNILHLLPDREKAIAKVHQMLKPGGVFVLSTVLLKDFVGASLFKGLFYIFGFFGGVVPTSLRFFTGEELQQSLACAGFEVELFIKGGTRIFPCCEIMIARKKKE